MYQIMEMSSVEESTESNDIVHIASCFCEDSMWTLCGLLDDAPIVDEIQSNEVLCIVCHELEMNGFENNCPVCS